MLTLTEILAQCHEDGDCMIWDGKLNSCGYPADSSGASLRRSTYAAAKGRPPQHRIRTSCGHRLCLNPDHLVDSTYSAIAKIAAAKRGLQCKVDGMKVAITRRAQTSKLDWDKVRELRASTESNEAAAKRLGITVGSVWQIRNYYRWREAIPGTSIFTSHP